MYICLYVCLTENTGDLAAMLERAKQQAADDYRRITQASEAKLNATVSPKMFVGVGLAPRICVQ